SSLRRSNFHGKRDASLEGALAAVLEAVLEVGTTVDSAGKASSRVVVAGVLHDSERAAADGATRLQPAVPLVRGARDGRPGVESDDVQEESGSPAQPRSGLAGLPGHC